MARHIAITTASNMDGSLELLALPEAVDPQEWEVVVVQSDGSRVVPSGGPGAGGAYPRFGAEQPKFKHSWYVDGFADCHAEVRVPRTGESQRVPLRPVQGRCRECQRPTDSG